MRETTWEIFESMEGQYQEACTRTWTDFISFCGATESFCELGNEPSVFMQDGNWLAELLLSSKEGLCLIELVTTALKKLRYSFVGCKSLASINKVECI